MRQTTRSEWKRTFKQLGREFLLPLVLALIFVLATFKADPAKGGIASQWIKDLFGTLAVVAYFSGNINRIRKQQRTEDEFAGARKRVEHVLATVEGGSGQCRMLFLPTNSAEKLDVAVVTLGTDPVEDLRIEIYPALEFSCEEGSGRLRCEPAGEAIFKFETRILEARLTRMLPPLVLVERGPGDALYVAQMTAKNGAWLEVIHATRDLGGAFWRVDSYLSVRNETTKLLKKFEGGFRY